MPESIKALLGVKYAGDVNHNIPAALGMMIDMFKHSYVYDCVMNITLHLGCNGVLGVMGC